MVSLSRPIVWTPSYKQLQKGGGRGYGDFKILNNGGEGWKNVHINGRLRHNGGGGRYENGMGGEGDPFQSNFDPVSQKYSPSVFQNWLTISFTFPCLLFQ